MEFSINKRVLWIRFTYCYCPLEGAEVVRSLVRWPSHRPTDRPPTERIHPRMGNIVEFYDSLIVRQGFARTFGSLVWSGRRGWNVNSRKDWIDLRSVPPNHQLTTCMWIFTPLNTERD